MSTNETSTLKLDLDAKKFMEGALSAEGAIKKIGNEENLKGLVEKLMHTGKVLGVIGTAVFAVKTAFDLAMDAEKVEKVNKQFEILSNNAGIASHELNEGLS